MITSTTTIALPELAESSIGTQLWRAVIARTIKEWISGSLRSRREAEQYLFEDNGDFPFVCQCAGMDLAKVRSRLAALRSHAIPDYLLALAA